MENKDAIKTLLLKAERCTDDNMKKAIKRKAEILRDNKTVSK